MYRWVIIVHSDCYRHEGAAGFCQMLINELEMETKNNLTPKPQPLKLIAAGSREPLRFCQMLIDELEMTEAKIKSELKALQADNEGDDL